MLLIQFGLILYVEFAFLPLGTGFFDGHRYGGNQGFVCMPCLIWANRNTAHAGNAFAGIGKPGVIFINGRHRAFDGTLSASDTGTVCLGNQFCAPLFFVRPVSGEVKGREII